MTVNKTWEAATSAKLIELTWKEYCEWVRSGPTENNYFTGGLTINFTELTDK